MALFGLNWEESKWPGHFCSIVLYFFASKIGVKLPPRKKVPWHRRCPVLSRGQIAIFSKKRIFQADKGIFSKSSFNTKMFSDPEYNFSLHQKLFFVVQSKVSIFHQIQPSHAYFKIYLVNFSHMVLSSSAVLVNYWLVGWWSHKDFFVGPLIALKKCLWSFLGTELIIEHLIFHKLTQDRSTLKLLFIFFYYVL